MSETDLVRGVIAALQARGIWCWRVNAGLTVLGKGKAKRVIRGAPAGTPDVFAIDRGRLLGIECKTPTGRLSDSQKAWHAKARAEGVHVVVVRSVREALDHAEQWIVAGRLAG